MNLLNIAEAAELCRISKNGLYVLIRQGRGPIVTRLGDRVLILERDLRRWTLENRETPRAA